MTDSGASSWSIFSLLEEYGAGLLVLGLGLVFLLRNMRTGQSGSATSPGLADVSADEQRKKRLDELQRQHNEAALIGEQKRREREAEKLQQKLLQLERTDGQGRYARQDDDPSSSSSKATDKNRLRASDYNPLMGGSSSGGYKPQKRKPPGGGCCGGGGCG